MSIMVLGIWYLCNVTNGVYGDMKALTVYETKRLQAAVDRISDVTTADTDENRKNIEELSENIAIDAFKQTRRNLSVCCSKSGRELYQVNGSSLNMLLHTQGTERTTEWFKIANRQAVAPQWLYTDPGALGKLMKYDPIGYFVYCAARVMTPLVEEYSFIHNETVKRDILCDHQAVLFNALETIEGEAKTIPMINKCNELMRRLLAICNTGYIPNKTNHIYVEKLDKSGKRTFKYKTLLNIAREPEKFAYQLELTLKAIVNHCYMNGQLGDNVSFDDFIRIRSRFKGLHLFTMQELWHKKLAEERNENNAFMKIIRTFASTEGKLRVQAMAVNYNVKRDFKPLPIQGTLPVKRKNTGNGFTLNLGGTVKKLVVEDPLDITVKPKVIEDTEEITEPVKPKTEWEFKL